MRHSGLTNPLNACEAEHEDSRTYGNPTQSASFRADVNKIGSSSLLVIQVHGSKIAPSEERVANGKILVNQWRNEHSCRDELSHHLVFTKSDEEPQNRDEVWDALDHYQAA
jgi:hypothetical protein